MDDDIKMDIRETAVQDICIDLLEEDFVTKGEFFRVRNKKEIS